MNSDVWRRVEDIYHAVMNLQADERAAFLAQACAGDTELHQEVESLLAQVGRADDLLENPAWSPLRLDR